MVIRRTNERDQDVIRWILPSDVYDKAESGTPYPENRLTLFQRH